MFSALPLKADISLRTRYIRFVPNPDIAALPIIAHAGSLVVRICYAGISFSDHTCRSVFRNSIDVEMSIRLAEDPMCLGPVPKRDELYRRPFERSSEMRPVVH